MLGSSYRKLSRVDERNDSQMIYYDQLLSNSTLLAYLNADHWGAAVPISRTHDVVGKLLVDRNASPSQALCEALLRLIEEDLENTGRSSLLRAEGQPHEDCFPDRR
jgi:hypothetical protein